MLVQCPKCKTTYKISEQNLRDAASVFRCSRCKHTFEMNAQESPSKLSERNLARQTARSTTADERELKFTFTPKSAPDAPPAPGARVDSPIRNAPTPQGREPAADQWELSGTDSIRDEAFIMSETESAAGDETGFSAPDDSAPKGAGAAAQPPRPANADNNILPLDPYRDQQAAMAPFLTLMGLLVIFFAVVTAVNRVHPNATEGIVKQIPLVGASVLGNNHLKNNVVLKALRADYQTIQGNRRVFVVTGAVANQNPVSVRAVQITGQIFDDAGKQLEQHTIWVGNAISQKIVRGLTVQDISNLQTLHPLKSFTIPPGDAISFAIVFLKPSDGVKDFVCEIVSAEGVA